MTEPSPSRRRGSYTGIGLVVGVVLGAVLYAAGRPGGFGIGFGIAFGVLGAMAIDPAESKAKRVGAAVLLAAVTAASVMIGRVQG